MCIGENVLSKRVERFQELLRENDIEVAVIRTVSSFIYFTGVKWLRPALMIPQDGEPWVMVFKNEKERFMERSWIKDVREYQKVEELMAEISSWIRRNGFMSAGLEISVERDSYTLFHELFKRLNMGVEIEDTMPLIMQLRMKKEPCEIEAMRRAGQIAMKGMERAKEIIEPGLSELDIAREVQNVLMKEGSEWPLVYVSVGPRIHAEPFKDIYVEEGKFVTVVIGTDYDHYYANMTRSFFIGEMDELSRKAIDAINRAYDKALEITKPGVRFSQIEPEIRAVYEEAGLMDYYIKGYTHGVGLLIEEPPITTIVTRHWTWRPIPDMTLAMIHTPLMLPNGAVKKEDTVLIKEDGVELLTYD